MLLCDHIDVNTAFLYATLNTPMYMNGPPGRPCKPGYCLKVIKALYGIRNAPRAWFQCLRDYLLKMLGFQESAWDPCLFFRTSSTGLLMIIYIYVDDILLFCSDRDLLNELKAKIRKRFKTKDLGILKKYIGIWVEFRGHFDSVFLHQSQYCQEITERFKECFSFIKKVKKTPLPASFHEAIAKDMEPPEEGDRYFEWVQNFPYLRMIGSALYLAVMTRVDIMFAVCMLARYSCKKTVTACKGLAHLFSYLSGTIHYGITYTINRRGLGREFYELLMDLYGMSDADWASDIRSRRSTAGFLVFALGGPLSWGSKLMTTIAASSMESEYMAAFYLGQTLLWIRGLMKELSLPLKKPIPFFMDAMAALNAIKNPALRQRSKHIDIKFKWLLMHAKVAFELRHVRSGDMSADLMTKPTVLSIFISLLPHVMGKEIRSSIELTLAQGRPKDAPYPKRLRIEE